MSSNNSFPDIYSADGSPMNDPRIGQLLRTSYKVGRLFELNYLHILDNKMIHHHFQMVDSSKPCFVLLN
ncbi:hypothetical protein SLEP1_g35942 [Rubroshorea leprosula]|uniref:Uncharacterized protein n=1 Tax=Rubroshorea leprosula TaxID=152421 RepID=A0AAV5KPV6_9ROSI|nr:hypothetical protein SLEP1_g35942 [Rubroshorea leprosula]